jgi:hypothetical protein
MAMNEGQGEDQGRFPPADFTVQCWRADERIPSPRHSWYVFTAERGASRARLEFHPDYGEQPCWLYTARLRHRRLARLYRSLHKAGFFHPDFEMPEVSVPAATEEISPGGIYVTAGGRQYKVRGQYAEPLRNFLGELFPAGVWSEIQLRREAFIAEYPEGKKAGPG